MSTPLDFDSTMRWLAITPHPDDEVLAVGGVLQAARRAEAAVRVVQLTGGENNPWPQRWLERRWRIDTRARARWARRRRRECEAGLRSLGLDPPAVLEVLGWPDGAITRDMMSAPAGMLGALAGALARFAPTHVLMPALDDRHPDHSAAAVLGWLASRLVDPVPRVMSYRVHGGGHGDLHHQLDTGDFQRKRAALEQHRSQIALSGGRMRRLAVSCERFLADPLHVDAARSPPIELVPDAHGVDILLPAKRWPPRARRGRRLLLFALGEAGVPIARTLSLGDAGPLVADPDRHLLRARIETGPIHALFAKLERERAGLWIYDRTGWRAIAMPT